MSHHPRQSHKSRDDSPLRGFRIAIIAHPHREADYAALVRRLGGQLLYATVEHLTRIPLVVRAADGTIYLTPWGCHKASELALRTARQYDRPMVICGRSGLTSVEQAVRIQLLPKILARAS